MLLFPLCFCIFHDLIKDIIRTLFGGFEAIQGVPKKRPAKGQATRLPPLLPLP